MMKREKELAEFVDKMIEDELRAVYRHIYGKGFLVGFATALTGAIVFFYITTSA
jgi:hypothetical protein